MNKTELTTQELQKIELILNQINQSNPEFKKKIALNQSETSNIIGVSDSTLRNWRREGIGIEYIKASENENSRILYPKISIAQYLAKTIKVL